MAGSTFCWKGIISISGRFYEIFALHTQFSNWTDEEILKLIEQCIEQGSHGRSGEGRITLAKIHVGMKNSGE